jgi:two-component system sensor histidine kinase BaeS
MVPAIAYYRIFRPLSLTARLFLAIAVVALVALFVGAWLVRRAVHYELNEQVTVMRTGGAEGPNAKQQVVREIVVTPDAAAAAQTLDRRLLAALALVLAGSAIATAVVAKRILGPVVNLREAAQELAQGNLSMRVPVEGAVELAALSDTFNLMAHRLEEQEQLKRDLTNDVAHELRTPITNLRCHIEAMTDGLVPLSAEALSTLAEDVKQLDRLVSDLGELAQADARQLVLHPEAVEVGEVVALLSRELAPRITAANLTLAADVQSDLPPVWMDRGRLIQILSNLLNNAIVHTPAGGRIAVIVKRRSTRVRIEVQDTGDGIEMRHLPYVFDRFYRADPSRSRRTGGAGLGLAITRQMILASGGLINVLSQPGHGTTFTVHLPLTDGFTAPSQPSRLMPA